MTSYTADIPLTLAVAAHEGTSFVPDRRGAQMRDEYAATLTADYEMFRAQADKGGTLDSLDAEFDRYREGYRKHYLAWLGSKSRCMSWMIAGRSNFPVRRQEKVNAVEHKRVERLIEFRRAAVAAVIRNLRPDLRPIMSGDGDAVERLREKIANAEAAQIRMKAANAAIRKHAKAGAEAQVTALVGLGFSEAVARAALDPDFCGRVGFAGFELTNNSANIRRLKERLAVVERNQGREDSTAEGEHAKLEDSPADNRVRLFFAGKPAEEIRAKLKKNGFRWSPTIGAWQAYRNHWSLLAAREVAGV